MITVDAAETDCLIIAFPQLIGADDGDTTVNVIIADGNSPRPAVYAAGGSQSAGLTGQGTTETAFARKYNSDARSSATAWSVVYTDTSSVESYRRITTMKLYNSWLYAIFMNTGSEQISLVVLNPNNGAVAGQHELRGIQSVNHNQLAVWSTSSFGVYILVASKPQSYDQAYLQTVNFESACLTYDSYSTCTLYKYNNKYELSTVAAGTYQAVEAIVMDEANDRVYAAISTNDNAAYAYKGNFIMRCDIVLTESSCTYVASQTSMVAEDYQPSTLSWYAGERVVGIGAARQNDAAQSSDRIYLWLERNIASNDHYYAWEVTLSQPRTFNFIESYRLGATTVYVTAFDSEASELYLMKWDYIQTDSLGAASDFTVTYEAQLVNSYCNAYRLCTIGASSLTTVGQYEGNTAQTFLYFAGSTQNHFDTYSNQIGFIATRTNSRTSCYDTTFSADDPDMTTFAITFTPAVNSDTNIIKQDVGALDVELQSHANLFAWTSGTHNQILTSTGLDKTSAGSSASSYQTPSATKQCDPWTDDFYFPSDHASTSVTTSSTYHYDGVDDGFSYYANSLFGNMYADVSCGFRTITWTITDTTTSVATGLTITTDTQTSQISSVPITLASVGGTGYEDVTKTYTIRWEVDANNGAGGKSGMNTAFRQETWSLRLVYKCWSGSTDPVPSIFNNWQVGQLIFNKYYDPTMTSAQQLSFTGWVPWILNDYCTVNTHELRNSDCTAISGSNTLDNADLFYQTGGTVAGETLTFEMNRNPTARIEPDTNFIIHTLTKCMYVENGHGVDSTQTFSVRLRCNSNYPVTPPTEMQSQINQEVYLDSELSADYQFDFSSYTDYQSTAQLLCILDAYDVYQTDESTAGYTGFTKASDTNKIVAIDHSMLAAASLNTGGSLPTYQFKIRGHFVGDAIGFSDIIQYKVVCGKEVLSISQTAIAGTDDFIYTYDQSGITDLNGGITTPTASILTSAYSPFMISNSSTLCPIQEWALFETIDETNEASMSTDTRITIDGYSSGQTYAITYKKFDDSASTTGGKNYYKRIYLRGYTSAWRNTLRPITNTITMKLVFDICGWESVIDPTVPDIVGGNITLIPPATTYYVEVGTNRSHTITFTDYTTDSTVWAVGAPLSSEFSTASQYAAGEPQCDIVSYTLWQKDSAGNYVSYAAELNSRTSNSDILTYKKSLRSWTESTRTFTIDTADDTTRLGTETFYIKALTRGNIPAYYPVETTLVCGQERMYTPWEPVVIVHQQNATWPRTNHTIQGFYSDMPYNCNITKFTIESVTDEKNVTLLPTYWANYFSIDSHGNFTFLKTDEVYNHMIVNISAETALIKSDTVWTLNVSVVPFFSVNTNSAPVFFGNDIKNFKLPDVNVYINHNYYDQPFVLPPIIDFQDDSVWIWLEQKEEEIFCKYDNNTRQFDFYNRTILENIKGIYKLNILIGDNHWLGSKTNHYTLKFIVDWAPVPFIIPAAEDKTSKGAKVIESSVKGQIKIDFNEKIFINPNYIPKRFLSVKKEETNTTWVIHEEPEPTPELPKDKESLNLKPEYIDEKILEIYVEPSPYQDKSKVNLTWVVDSLTETSMVLQMKFEHYEFISIEGLDQIVVIVKNNNMILSQKDGKQIFNKGYEIRQKLRKQLPLPSKFLELNNTDLPDTTINSQIIDSDFYEAGVAQMESITKQTLFTILVWSFLSGNKNLDFVWSYLASLQILSHLGLLKNQIPMNAMMMTKSLLSISLLDIKEVQSTLLKNSFFDVSAYASKLIEILDPPTPRDSIIINVERQIAQYQFFEHEYKESYSFFSNLRSMRVLLFAPILFWPIAAIMYQLIQKSQTLRESWKFTGAFRRVWGFMGVNAILRVLFLQYILVIFAGYTVFRTRITKIYLGKLKDLDMDREFASFAFCIFIPIMISTVLTCMPKERLRKEYTEITFNTLYYKSNLKSFWSKAYLLLFLIQRLGFAAIIIGIDDICIQLGAMMLYNMLFSQVILKIDSLYIDPHLRRFDKINQAFISFIQMGQLLFTDHVYERQMQFDFGYYYAFTLYAYNAFCLITCAVYALEPIRTLNRLRNLRLQQIRLAIELRARLIREAKERKEERKQRKLDRFNNFEIDLGVGNETVRQSENQDLSIKLKDENSTPKKIGGRLRGPKINIGGYSTLDAIQEEDNEIGSMNFSLDQPNQNLVTQEGDAERQSAIDLNDAFNRLEMNDRDNQINFQNNEDSDEENNFDSYASILDKLSLIDKQGYVDLIKKNNKIKKMREQLVLADLDDNKSDLKKSKKIAAGINSDNDNLVSRKELKKQYAAIQNERDMTTIEQVQPDEYDNIEYQAMIAALDQLSKEILNEMQLIEKDNGIGQEQELQDNQDPRTKLNILDVFGIEINN